MLSEELRLEYGKFFDEILKLDQNIRFVAIFDGQLHAKFREGIQGYFSEEEIKVSASEAQDRWRTRKKMIDKIGEAEFAMARYEKVYRLTFPLREEDVVLVTSEREGNIDQIVDKVIQTRNKFFGKTFPYDT